MSSGEEGFGLILQVFLRLSVILWKSQLGTLELYPTKRGPLISSETI